jgi:hypothetical protein
MARGNGPDTMAHLVQAKRRMSDVEFSGAFARGTGWLIKLSSAHTTLSKPDGRGPSEERHRHRGGRTFVRARVLKMHSCGRSGVHAPQC